MNQTTSAQKRRRLLIPSIIHNVNEQPIRL
jgi:hypothetical protein